MATNNECLIIILDVRLNASEDFKVKSVKCVADIIKEKICGGKRDYISFILLGTLNTLNDLNSSVCEDNYKSIVQYPHVQECTWQLLTNFYKLANEPASNDGEWLDALVLAMQMVKQAQMTFKFQRSRILLLYDFNDVLNNYDQYDTIVDSLVKENIQLVIISDNVLYIDDPETGEPQAIFAKTKKTELQMENEAKALELSKSCADLGNFVEAPNLIAKVYNKRPWPWNATLSIGTKLRIRITGILAVKDDSKIHMKKRWAAKDQQVNRVLKFYLRGEEIQPLPMDLIDAYMLCQTPIPYEEADEEDGAEKPEKGLRLLGFTKRADISDEYYCGNNTYWVMHQKGVHSAARKLTALAMSMKKLDLVMLCWKVYSEKLNKPKMVVLLPNELIDGQPATFTMIEHIYYQQKLFWDVPSLANSKKQRTPEQLQAVDDLIDAMDLTMDEKTCRKEPRATRSKDLLPLDSFPHIYEQNMMDCLERKVINASVIDDEQFAELLKDKNFVEAFWKVPEHIEEQAKCVSAKLKELFPLEKDPLAFVRMVEHQQNAAGKQPTSKPKDVKDEEYHHLPYNKVSEKSPAEDYRQLIRHKVLTINDRTRRNAAYEFYTEQLQMVLWSLLKKPQLDGIKLGDGLKAFRETCIQFNAFEEYNEWIGYVRTFIMDSKLHDFWQAVIVEEDLGLCFCGDLTVREKLRQREFYRMTGGCGDDTSYDEMDDPAIDGLMAEMDV